MGATANYQLPYPDGTDQPFVHLDMKAQAERLDEVFTDLYDDPSVLVRRVADLTIPTGQYTAIAFDTAEEEHGGELWSAAQPTRLVAPRAGRYLVACCINFAGINAGSRYVFIRKNSAGAITGGTPLAFSGSRAAESTHGESVSIPSLRLAAGDYIEVFALQNTAGALAVDNDGLTFAGLEFRGL